MKTRIITGVFIAAAYVGLFFASKTIVFPIVWSILCCIGLFEMFRCIGVVKNALLTVSFYLLGFSMPIIIYLCDSNTTWELGFFMAIFIVMLLCFALSVFSKGQLPVEQVAMTYMSGIYIVIGFALFQGVSEFTGGVWLWAIGTLGTITTDVFAYFTGRFFGKHKLIPDVSPKKTVEGSIGGTIFGIVSVYLLAFLFKQFDGTFEINILRLIICSALIVVISQIGDLLMSLIKRHYGIKDYGKLFPGHGGVLDRFDSNIAVMMVIFGYNQLWPIFSVVTP